MQNGNSVGSLSEDQQSLIVGSLLGDGYMRCKTNAHLQVTHSINQKTYVDWKYRQLMEYILTPPKSYKGNGKRIGYRFFTRSLPEFTHFYKRFYVEGKKIIPRRIRITPLTLAVWYMDDGSKSGKSSYLNTQHFTWDDQEFLREKLFKNFGLNSSLDRDKIYFRIRFPVNDSKRLVKIIKPFVLPFMEYKLPV